MKYYTFIATSLALVLPVLSQDITSLPQCAQPKVLNAISSSGCSLTDIACICKKQSFIDGLLVEIPKVCTPDEIAKSTDVASKICLGYGVTLSLPNATSTAGSSTASSRVASTTSSASIEASATSTTNEAVPSATDASATTTPTSGAATNGFGANYFIGAVAIGLTAVFWE